jgi:hypothetical protein
MTDENSTYLTTILLQVDKVFASIKSHPNDSTRLLMDANNLTTLLFNVAPLYVDERSATDALEVEWKNAVNETYLGYKKQKYTDGESRIRAELENIEMKRKYLKHKKLSERLGFLRKDMENKVSVLQSFSRELRSEKTGRPQL